ncbi:MamI restriction endonuclease [Flavobacterium psychrophilum]|uniref:MamI family restriction endonuclease n=1 Tax=Flavobacterium psychrophilum TaxID=96345 RepID=UPI000B7C220D|nr:MamI family restriction endonuclease [Flavobacterium psychrophilum]SNB15463.1 MamI restriction endonuclease [Flavobacterium psychrophilum]
MQPNLKLVTIDDNVNKITKLIHELVLEPRIKALEWSEITKQTPNMKIGYPGQHLASLVVGMEGCKTGARGNDIVDGSEVKSCSRVDASDKCTDCGEKLSRTEMVCGVCGSAKISRDNTSKWLFTIRDENDLKVLTKDLDRVLLVLADYPEFHLNNFDNIQFQVFEIWNNSERCKEFTNLMTNYYNNIYKVHKGKDTAKTPAPKNFWPYSYQFYKCNPIKVFSCIVKNANKKPVIEDIFYIDPKQDRSGLNSELMPSTILTKDEVPSLVEMLKKVPKALLQKRLVAGKTITELSDVINSKSFSKTKISQILPHIDEDLREYLPLRLDKTFVIKTKHKR